jgi:hypothetical protein
MKRYYVFFIAGILILNSCIKDDFVDDFVEPRIMISNPLTSLAINNSYQFQAEYFNNVGSSEDVPLTWSSSDTTLMKVDENGLATGVDYGSVTLSVEFMDNNVSEQLTFFISDSTTFDETGMRNGVLETTSSYDLEGNFMLRQEGDKLILEFDETYICDMGLPGAYIYLTNNPSTNNDAYEVGPVETFEGVYQITIEDNELIIDAYDYVLFYCKPFSVKIGDGKFEN